MKVHHLNCATFRPPLVAGGLVAHCLLIETDQGLVLVDTGFGTNEVINPKATIDGLSRKLLKPVLDITETAISHVEKRGYTADDVRHVLLTHLDLDHAGGLRDFPKATVHVLDTELEAATNARSTKERARYPKAQRDGVKFETHKAEGEDWFGFQAVKNIAGLPEEVLMVPLIGHTRGHTGIAVKSDDGWLLHAGDAYFYRGEVETPPSNIFALKLTAKQTETIREQRLSNVERLRELKASGEAEVFCAHDPVELARLA
ncbi:MBL fold metallo-hydrolase [Lentzea flaviverrucosa]|uniref:Glyoxylase, beta-lactamase superfamily II n=1 Tax=Lentzea flaviverrucosa TaxID=200379 RepID=A0A1H9LZD2_9PSEU|nr:MBL fold metallo-hydrolase [Lentzea flaviverrucosa]RDI31136.1 glyoxylase-like metal-dependent hydrolase (beta-lactamase superfamily II) [Lentzea flaviverrucosa]SER16625.1 Glyoxylase, beta-lactamase superfamily II [Lentzea flaviverrucosa]